MRTHRVWVVGLMLAVLLGTFSAASYAKKKKKGPPTRSVKGLVTDQAEEPLAGAVVQLKNTRTLQVKSFITNAQGAYYFHGLDMAADYEMKARYLEDSSRTRTVSSLDGRDMVIFNFKIKLEK
jgi:hypothetical protein